MMRNFLTLNSIFLTACCLAAMTAFTGCKDSNDKDSETGILRPIAENVIGKWNMEKSQKKQDGKWVEDPIPEGEGHIYTILTDGTALSAFTAPDGYTKLNLGEWKVDEATGKLTLGTMTVDVLGLDATSLVMGHDEARDSETGEIMKGEFRWTFARMDESQKTLAEQLVGKWILSKSYEKKNGEWVENSNGLPDEGWHLYRANGTFTAYSRTGEHELTSDTNWVVNCTTGTVRWTAESGQSSTATVTIETDGTLSVFYANSFDPVTGQSVAGEFKDVMVRAQE
ncbi:hypothetical protein [Phocaeicola vulgatus]|nr:hypothetical protein [Phocaeicola vulgatus]